MVECVRFFCAKFKFLHFWTGATRNMCFIFFFFNFSVSQRLKIKISSLKLPFLLHKCLRSSEEAVELSSRFVTKPAQTIERHYHHVYGYSVIFPSCPKYI